MQHIIKNNSLVAIVANSNGLESKEKHIVDNITTVFKKFGLKTITSPVLYRQNGPFNAPPEERARHFMHYFENPDISAIFDISGGDAANQILPFLDFTRIAGNGKAFFGISDITPVLNALYVQAGIRAYHFTARNLVSTDSFNQAERFNRLFITGKSDFNTFSYSFIKGNTMQGKLIGGNLRCFLKLAGTQYMPLPEDRILFLESLGGDPCRIGSYLAQLEQLGYFKRLNGVLLGTFSHMQLRKLKPTVEEMMLTLTKKYRLPIAVTGDIGHGTSSHCLVIGKEYFLHK